MFFSPGEVPRVNVTLWRTSANEMFVHYESSGWFLKPHISLLDAKRKEIHAQAESLHGPDDLYSVRAQVDAATARGDSTPAEENTACYVTGDIVLEFNASCIPPGTGTIICRVEIPGTSVRRETQISIIGKKCLCVHDF